MRAWMLTAVLAPALAAAAPAPAPMPWASSGIADWTVPPPLGAEPVFTPPVPQRLALANGMAVLVIERHELPIVALQLLVPNAGAAQDPRGKAGLAAFTADMLDEGAGALTATGIAQEADRLGAEVRTLAGPDDARIAVTTLAANLAPTLALVSAIAIHPTFDPREVARVGGDRTTAIALRSDRPRELASDVLAAALYGAGTPYGHPTDGERDEVASITAADVQGFYRAHWNPAAMTLVVVGDVEPGALMALLAPTLGAWAPVKTAIAAPAIVPAPLARRLLLVDRPEAPQSEVRVGLVGPSRKDTRYAAFEVMTSALGGGFITSRLNQRLREQLGITYGIRGTMDWRVGGGTYAIGSAIATKETGHGLAEILRLVDGMSAADLPAAELDRAKLGLVRSLPARFATNAQTAQTVADLALFGLADDWYARYADNVRKVTARDVRAAAKLIPAAKLVVTVVGDLAAIGPSLDALGLGAPALHDRFGAPTK